MSVCVKCYAEFSESDCVFCPDRGYLCSFCSNQEHVVSCLDCGEHFPFYSMKEINGRALCEEDYNKEVRERELDVEKTEIAIDVVDEDEVGAKTVIDPRPPDEKAEISKEIEELKKIAVYGKTLAHEESGAPRAQEPESREELFERDRESSHIMSEGIFRDPHYVRHGYRGHHPVSFY